MMKIMTMQTKGLGQESTALPDLRERWQKNQYSVLLRRKQQFQVRTFTVHFYVMRITLVDVYATATATESIADDYENVEGSGSEEHSTTRPRRDMTEINIEKETTTSGLWFSCL